MRKTMFWLLSMFLFATLPALAQHNHQGGARATGGGNRGVQHEHGTVAAHQERGERGKEESRGVVRGEAHGEHGYNYARGDNHGFARAHWSHGRFEEHYFASHWGGGNRFYFGRCNWWGPRFYVGSYFWFNDAYFVIVDEIPYDWYDTEVYVDYIDGRYYIVSPFHPGVRFAVAVRF